MLSTFLIFKLSNSSGKTDSFIDQIPQATVGLYMNLEGDSVV